MLTRYNKQRWLAGKAEGQKGRKIDRGRVESVVTMMLFLAATQQRLNLIQLSLSQMLSQLEEFLKNQIGLGKYKEIAS